MDAPPNGRLAVLVVAADADLRALYARALDGEGHPVREVGRGASAIGACEQEPPDLVLLDVDLPDVSGLDVCRALRALPGSQHTPILMLSSRGDDLDRVSGLEAGADDYVVKPVTVRELVLRMRSLGRRVCPPAAPSGGPALRVDLDGLLAFVGGEERTLTRTESQLLRLLFEHPGRALSRREIRDRLWGGSEGAGERSIDSHIRRLRRKLAPAGRALQTVRGVGYRYRADR